MSAHTSQAAKRPRPSLPAALFAGALLAYAVALPLGLGHVAAAGPVAGGVALDAHAGGGALASLAVRAAAYLPLGDVSARANLAAVLWTALAVALLGWWVTELGTGTQRHEPPGDAASAGAEGIAAAGGSAVAGLSLGFFTAAAAPGGGAPTLAYAALSLGLLARLVRVPRSSGAGALLSLLAGLAPGIGATAPALVWPPALIVSLWALRRGARWPLFAPLLFAAGAGLSLVSVARGEHPAQIGELITAVARPWHEASAAGMRALGREATEQIGVVGALLGVVGLGTLALRAPALLAATLWTLAVGLVLPRLPGLGVAVAAMAAPVAAGILRLASGLGRARAAAAAALAVIAAVSPALDGGASRWRHDVRTPARLVEAALDREPLRAAITSRARDVDALFAYAAALGLRPDLRTESRLARPAAAPPR